MNKKAPPSNKPRRSKSSRKRLQQKQRRTQSSSEFSYDNLEPRYALDASFTFDDGDVNLFDFSGGVIITNAGNTFTATLPDGNFAFLDDGDPVEPDDIPGNITINGGMLTVGGGLNSLNIDLNGNFLNFGETDLGAPIIITDAGDINQDAPVDLGEISISGTGTVNLINEENELDVVDIDLEGDLAVASVFSLTSISGDTFSADISVDIDTFEAVTFNEIDSLGSIQVTAALDANVGVVGNPLTLDVDIDAASITATSVTTFFDSVEADVNNVGAEPLTSVRLRATGGTPTIGIFEGDELISDTPIGRDNTAGGIEITEGIVSDQILLQSSNGIDIDIDGIDTLRLFLGGELEAESRGEFQLNVPSLQQLSVSLFDGFAITSEQDLTIGNFSFTGLNPFDFTNAFSDLFASITAVSLTFDAPFETQQLVADATIDIGQNPGAFLTVDDIYLEGESVILDNVNNDFQRIAAIGQGFQIDDRLNNEDVLVIRDQGELEIAVLDNLPADTLVVDFATPLVPNTLNGISIAGQVDILTGLGSPLPVQPEGAVEPSFAQLGNTAGSAVEFQIESFARSTSSSSFTTAHRT